MPVRKFRSINDVKELWREPGSPELSRAIERVWTFGHRTMRRRFPPGVHRRRNLVELNEATEQWNRANFEEATRLRAAEQRQER